MQIGVILSLVFAFVVLVAGLILTPIILNQTNTTQTNDYIDNFAGVSDLIGLVPLVVVVGLLALAGIIAFVAIKNQGKIAGGGGMGR